MNRTGIIKNTAILLIPILSFFVLVIPYEWLNRNLIVDWLGCGCAPFFNANHFTALFWFLMSVGATVAAILLSGRILRSNIVLRIVYVLGVSVVSLLIAAYLCRMMQWN